MKTLQRRLLWRCCIKIHVIELKGHIKNRGSEGGIRMVNLFFIVVSACLVSTDVLLWMLWAGERRNQLV